MLSLLRTGHPKSNTDNHFGFGLFCFALLLLIFKLFSRWPGLLAGKSQIIFAMLTMMVPLFSTAKASAALLSSLNAMILSIQGRPSAALL
jgi:hypothetical protein